MLWVMCRRLASRRRLTCLSSESAARQLAVCFYLQVDSGLVAPEFAQGGAEILLQQNKTELDLDR